jgi:hypothetical protein
MPSAPAERVHITLESIKLDPMPADGQRPTPDSGDTPSPLPRPGMNIVNRVAVALTGHWSPRRVERSELDRWVDASIAAMADLGADPRALAAVRSDSREWKIDPEPAPKEVWCGEIFWSEGEPDTHIYPDSPWGRIPSRTIFEIGAQTGVDHMVSHLYRYAKDDDYSEAAACTDQVRLMLARPGLLSRVAGVAICIGLRFHKEIPLREFRQRLAIPVPQ